MTKTMQTLSEKKSTTVVGILTTLSGLVVSLIPNSVWETCSAAIADTPNAAFTGSLVGIGILLTTLGPSIAKRSAS